ncbi:MAG: globin family protein [Oscillatoria sp. PMC 1068.18]|nr:globin family protein [Oscillatoria sp. PMC 1076.18]MEC4988135.1 globin family protein [Oscillatoria sp. PMC 1068.18]
MSLKIQLLEASFEKIKPQSQEFSQSFYRNLFLEYPELEQLFANTNLVEQQRKLILSLALIVDNLRSPETLDLALKSLGAYHVKTGTVKEHYPLLGDILLATFADFLGANWTEELAQSWREGYETISNLMLEGAKNPEAYLHEELTFYEWLELYGESSPYLIESIGDMTDFKYRKPV